MMHTVYILYSITHNTIYIGETSSFIQRYYSHNIYGHDWTKRYRPWIVILTEFYETRRDALAREKQLKSGQGRACIWDKIKTQYNQVGYISMEDNGSVG